MAYQAVSATPWQLAEIEAGMAQQVLFAAEHGGEADISQFVPSNISPLSFATFCWDNNDVIAETLSGQGTTHCTNGIVVQRQVQFAANQPHPTTSVQRAASSC